MFRHQYPRPNLKSIFLSGSIDGLNRPEMRAIFAEKRQPMKTREGQEMGTSRFIVVFDTFSMFDFHVTKVKHGEWWCYGNEVDCLSVMS